MANNDVYTKIFSRVLEQMEQGVAPWVRPWSGDSTTPYNAATGRAYTGGNILILWAEGMGRGFKSNGWLTFKQAIEAGCVVRKGEQGTPVFFFSTATAKQGKDKDSTTGEEEAGSRYFFARAFTVFNVEQLGELDAGNLEALKSRHGADAVIGNVERIEACEEMVAATGADIQHGWAFANYQPNRDVIRMPDADRFVDREAYYGTLFHELVHWTGHETRLKREIANRFASPAYAFEELVAELGAAFVAGRFGIETVDQSAAYLASWVKACREHPDLLPKAASLASKAADYLAGASAPAAVAAI